MSSVKTPYLRLGYEGADISADIASCINRFRLTDHIHARADEVELTLDNVDHRWLESWWPGKHGLLEPALGYEGEAVTTLGQYVVEEVEASRQSGGDAVTLRALAAGTAAAMRTRLTREFEDITLDAVIAQIASSHGLAVVGDIAPIRFQRLTQREQSDVDFITQLGDDWGYGASIRGHQLCFVALEVLAAAPSIRTLTPADVTDYSLKDRAKGIYHSCEISYTPPRAREPVIVTIDADAAELDATTSADTLRLEARVENDEQARTKARAALLQANRKLRSGRIGLQGDPALSAGVHIDLSGWGQLSGKYQIIEAKHTLDSRSGYRMELEICRVK